MNRLAPLPAILLASSGAAFAADDPAAEKSVGVATMLANGTILVGVRGPEPERGARAVLMVEPGDTNYQMIIDHLGGLKPGETKSIPPWPDPVAPAPMPKEDGSPTAPPSRG